MGLFDSVAGMLAQGSGAAQPDLSGLVSTFLQHQPGALGGLVGRLQEAGLGEQVASWISAGGNLPITPEQLHSVISGHPMLAGLLAQTGLSEAELLEQLAKLLPLVIDQLTPHGHLPEGQAAPSLGGQLGGQIEGLVGGLLGR